MKRISAIVKGVSESVKASFKEKRINKAVDAAMLNAQEDLEVAKARLEELPEHVQDMDAEDIVSQLSDIYDEIEVAEATIARIEKIKKYLAEDVEDTVA